MGIKNNMFMLELNNTSLDGVDPYGADLTPIQKEHIVTECRNNIWYFIREVVQIKECGTDDFISFSLNPANMAALFFLSKGISIYELGTRFYSYKTMSVIVYLLWLNGCNVMIPTNTKNPRHTNARIIEIHDALPSYLKSNAGVKMNVKKRRDIVWLDDAETLPMLPFFTTHKNFADKAKQLILL